MSLIPSQQTSVANLLAVQKSKEQKPWAFYEEGIRSLLAVLGFGVNDEDMAKFGNPNDLYRNMMQELNLVAKMDQMPEIKSAMAFFFDITQGNLNATFYNTLKDYVMFRQLDFRHNATESTKVMNAWIAAKSGLENVLSEKEVFQTIMIPVNTLWFKDEWVTKFLESRTRPLPFTTIAGTSIELPTMVDIHHMDYFVDPNSGAKGVRLPFKNGSTAEFVMGLDSAQVFDFPVNYQRGEVSLRLPKFVHKETYDLTKLLTIMGFGFLGEEGHLMKINGNWAVKINKGVQIIEVTFDEGGAEVKAVTYMMCPVPQCMAPAYIPPIDIFFDRPFHYRITKQLEGQQVTIVSGYFNGNDKGGKPLGPAAGHTQGTQLTYIPPLVTNIYSAGESLEVSPMYNVVANVVLIGNTGVGKTSLLHKLQTGKSSDKIDRTLQTYDSLIMLPNGNRVRIYDTPGSDPFIGKLDEYYTKCDSAIVMFDLTSRMSARDINVWIRDFMRINPNAPIVVVGNKTDAVEKRLSKKDVANIKSQAREMKNNIKYCEISVSNYEGCSKPFELLIK